MTLIAAFLFSALAARASAQDRADFGSPCGVPVWVFQTGQGGLSTVYMGRPVIVLDPGVAFGDPDFRRFTLLHECGHHANGDTLPQGMASRWFMSRQQELSADCYAAHRVPEHISEETARLFEATQGGFSPAPGYPTGNERAANVRRCANIEARPQRGRRSGCPGLPPGMSLICRFTSGPAAGHSLNFCGVPGAVPTPVGSPCSDGGMNSGFAE